MRGGPRVRLFIALDLPEPVRDALASWRDELLAGRRDLRPVATRQLHATLAFLGSREESEVERIATAAFGAVAGLAAPRLLAGPLRPVPAQRPRLFALGLEDEDGRAAALQSAVAGGLERERLFRPEARPFWPHLTLARVRRGERPGPLRGERPPLEAFDADELTLYRSTLRPQGALYEPLARARVDGT